MTTTARHLTRTATWPVRRMATRSFTVSRYVGLLRRRRALARSTQSPVVIHQPGKVGSSSIASALAAAAPGRTIFQVHHLTPESIRCEERQYRSEFGQRRRIDRHLLDSWCVRSLLDQDRLPRATLVVTIVRDPMAQRFSSFFQTLRFRMPEIEAAWAEDPDEGIVDRVVEHFHDPGWWHDDRFDEFFSTEFRPVWGVDVLAVPFDHVAGRETQEHAQLCVLVLRFEDLGAVGAAALADTLGIESITLAPRQVSDRKPYAPLMRLVRDRLDLDDGYLDAAYRSVAIDHFYTDAEVERFRRRWTTRD